MTSTGTIPNGIQNMTRLDTFDITQNALHGTIPTDFFNHKPNLKTLFLGSNRFSGTAPSISSTLLERLDISDNAFSGKLPGEYFTLPKLQVLSASLNCLSVQLPGSLCNSSDSLLELYLNGLHQSSNCFGAISQESLSELSSCIWSRKSLMKIYLAGNRYSGSLEGSFDLPNISELGLTSNRFYGTLPTALNDRKMNYFDVSSNHFVGTIDNVLISPANENTTTAFNVHINRLSGPISTAILKTFSSIDVLSGNVFSCNTLPENDPSYTNYSCGSQDLEIALYFWLSSVFSVVVILLICSYCNSEWFQKWREQISELTLIRSDEVKSSFPRSVHFLYSLQRLAKATIVVVMLILGMITLFFVPLKLNPDYSSFSSYTFQYLYLISGVFLKGPTPAFILVGLHLFVACLLLGVYFLIYVKEWTIIRLSNSTDPSVQSSMNVVPSNIIRSMILWSRYILKSLTVLSFILISVLGNVGYILLRNKLKGINLFFLQLTLQLLNTSLSCFLPIFIEFLFPGKPHSLSAARLMIFLMCFLDTVTPFVATLVGDDRCFQQMVSQPSSIELSYTYDVCIVPYSDYDRNCFESQMTERSLSFLPPFIYSGICRDAVLTNFIPVIILSNVLQGFIYPLFYIVFTDNQVDLKGQILLFGWFRCGLLEDYILTASYLRLMMARIWSSLLILLTYGIVSPFVTVTAGINALSQIYFLRANICRFFHLQRLSKDGNTVETEKGPSSELETFCRDSQTTIDVMLWPGLIMSSTLFALYVYDMAYDTDNLDPVSPMLCLILSLIVIPPVWYVFHHFKMKLERQREINIQHSNSLEISEVMNPISCSRE